MIHLIRKEEGNVTRFFVENLKEADVTVTFELGLRNLKGSSEFPLTATFPPGKKVEAFSLSPVVEDQEWGFSLTNHSTVGNCFARHDDSVVYELPYAPGKAYRVSQGSDGGFSHQGPERHAIDWVMPIRTPVCAARSGIVVSIKSDSNQGGPDRKFEHAANYILIEHSDGTIGNYAHLDHEGVLVQTGQKVSAGEVIGYSGNTGFSSGPHLHFCVFRARNGKERESFPVRFRTSKGAGVILKAGQTYLHEELKTASSSH